MREAPSVGQYVKQHDEQSSLILWEQISGHNNANDINCRFNAKDQNHVQYIKIKACESIIFKCQLFLTIIISLSARILHRAQIYSPAPSGPKFLTQKIVADPKMRCHQKSFGIWKVTEAILGKKTWVFFKKHILEKNYNNSHYFFNF